MPNTKSSWTMDTGLSDGKIIIGPQDMLLSVAAAADAVLTRNAAGDWSWNQIAAKTNIYAGIVSSSVLERIGLAGDFQENYGTATPGNAAGAGNAAFTGNQGGPQSFPGRPPFAGAGYLAPVVGNLPKGFKLTDVTFVYSTLTADLTAITCRVDKTIYANTVAPNVAAVLASGVNGLLVTTNAQPRVIKVATPGALFNFTDNSEIIVELSVQTAGGGTARIYRMILHGTFNYN